MKIYTRTVWQMTPDGMQLIPEECESFDYEGPVAECKKDNKSPAPPDPWVTAAAQTAMNQNSAAFNTALNRTNTYTPLGSHTWAQTGTDPVTGAPTYEQRIALDPEQQALLDQQTRQSLNVGQVGDQLVTQARDAYGRPMNTSGLPELRRGADMSGLPGLPGSGDLEGFRNQQTNALYDRNTAYLDRQFTRDEDSMRTRLANQGVVEGSEAFRNAMDDFSRGKETAYRQARNESIAGGGAEAERMFGIGSQTRGQLYGEALGNAGFENQAREQGMSEMFALRNQPINELNAIRTMSQAQMPQFGASGGGFGTNPADISGAIQNQYQGQLDQSNANNAARNQERQAYTQAAMQGLMMYFGAMSDKRTKDDHGVIGKTKDDIPVHLFNYKGSDKVQVGVMAQEAEKKRPDAVMKGPDGLKRVNYFALS
jgi:hypothetical protein